MTEWLAYIYRISAHRLPVSVSRRIPPLLGWLSKVNRKQPNHKSLISVRKCCTIDLRNQGIRNCWFLTVLILESGWRWLRFSQSLDGIWSRGCCWPCEGNEPRGIEKPNLLIAAGSTWQSSDGWLLKTKRRVQQQLDIPPKVMCCCCLPICERDRMMLEV